MPSGSDLLSQLEAAGLTLAFELSAGFLPVKVTPASRITPELRQLIREHKAKLLHYLARVASGGERVRVTSVKSEEPGRTGCVVWEQ